MQPDGDFIDRTIAALEGDPGVPEDIRKRLLGALLEYRDTPSANLEKLLGIKPGRGQSPIAIGYRDQHCGRLYRRFCKAHYNGVAPTTAAKDIDFNFDELAKNRDDPHVAKVYKELYDEVIAVKGKVPKWRAIYNALQSNR